MNVRLAGRSNNLWVVMALVGLAILLGTAVWTTRVVDAAPTAPQGNAGLGDLVWHDINVNGLQEPTEPGINNVFIDIYPLPSLASAPGSLALASLKDYREQRETGAESGDQSNARSASPFLMDALRA